MNEKVFETPTNPFVDRTPGKVTPPIGAERGPVPAGSSQLPGQVSLAVDYDSMGLS